EQLVVGEQAARLIGADGRSELAADDRVSGVAEPQLELRADERLLVHPELVPAGGGEHEVDAEAAAALKQVGEHGLEFLELGAHESRTVDEDDDVGGDELRHAARGVLGAQRRDRVETALAEYALALREHSEQLLEEPSQPVPVGARRDAAD